MLCGGQGVGVKCTWMELLVLVAASRGGVWSRHYGPHTHVRGIHLNDEWQRGVWVFQDGRRGWNIALALEGLSLPQETRNTLWMTPLVRAASGAARELKFLMKRLEKFANLRNHLTCFTDDGCGSPIHGEDSITHYTGETNEPINTDALTSLKMTNPKLQNRAP